MDVDAIMEQFLKDSDTDEEEEQKPNRAVCVLQKRPAGFTYRPLEWVFDEEFMWVERMEKDPDRADRLRSRKELILRHLDDIKPFFEPRYSTMFVTRAMRLFIRTKIERDFSFDIVRGRLPKEEEIFIKNHSKNLVRLVFRCLVNTPADVNTGSGYEDYYGEEFQKVYEARMKEAEKRRQIENERWRLAQERMNELRTKWAPVVDVKMEAESSESDEEEWNLSSLGSAYDVKLDKPELTTSLNDLVRGQGYNEKTKRLVNDVVTPDMLADALNSVLSLEPQPIVSSPPRSPTPFNSESQFNMDIDMDECKRYTVSSDSHESVFNFNSAHGLQQAMVGSSEQLSSSVMVPISDKKIEVDAKGKGKKVRPLPPSILKKSLVMGTLRCLESDVDFLSLSITERKAWRKRFEQQAASKRNVHFRSDFPSILLFNRSQNKMERLSSLRNDVGPNKIALRITGSSAVDLINSRHWYNAVFPPTSSVSTFPRCDIQQIAREGRVEPAAVDAYLMRMPTKFLASAPSWNPFMLEKPAPVVERTLARPRRRPGHTDNRGEQQPVAQVELPPPVFPTIPRATAETQFVERRALTKQMMEARLKRYATEMSSFGWHRVVPLIPNCFHPSISVYGVIMLTDSLLEYVNHCRLLNTSLQVYSPPMNARDAAKILVKCDYDSLDVRDVIMSFGHDELVYNSQRADPSTGLKPKPEEAALMAHKNDVESMILIRTLFERLWTKFHNEGYRDRKMPKFWLVTIPEVGPLSDVISEYNTLTREFVSSPASEQKVGMIDWAAAVEYYTKAAMGTEPPRPDTPQEVERRLTLLFRLCREKAGVLFRREAGERRSGASEMRRNYNGRKTFGVEFPDEHVPLAPKETRTRATKPNRE